MKMGKVTEAAEADVMPTPSVVSPRVSQTDDQFHEALLICGLILTDCHPAFLLCRIRACDAVDEADQLRFGPNCPMRPGRGLAMWLSGNA